MLKLGIIGYPLEHSLSPIMHTAALQRLNILGEYKAYSAQEDELKKLFNKLKEEKLRGFNVTIPHKQSISSLVDEISEIATLIGAVNTVTFDENGKSKGDNTDVLGFWDSLPQDIRDNIANSRALILGYGGSSLAVCTALMQHKANELIVCGRNKEKLESFQTWANNTKSKLGSNTKIVIQDIHSINLSDIHLLVNTIPIGMHPNVDASPLNKTLLHKLPKNALVYDLIYNPIETKLLKEAKSVGLKTQNGLSMLVKQGALSLEIWLNKKVSATASMEEALQYKLLRPNK